jgi:(p)ppGpp synthase/HD superfamily hydrolase
MVESVRLAPRFARPYQIASIVHEGVTRKGTAVAYIEHPVAVADILRAHGYGDDLAVAGLLHDTVEDAQYDSLVLQQRLGALAGPGRLPVPGDRWVFRSAYVEFLGQEFGGRVLDLVMAVTESKNDGRPRRDWLERKKEQLDRLAGGSPDEAALKAADALHNIETTLADIERQGLGVLDRFRSGSLIVWHYSALAQLASQRMPSGSPLAAAVCEAAGRLQRTVRELRPAPSGRASYPPPTVY